MSSYRKKRYPQKNQDTEQNWQPDIEFSNPGVEKAIHTGRLTSGLPYQRPVNPREVERLIREWDGRLLEPVVVSFRDGKFYVVDGPASDRCHAENEWGERGHGELQGLQRLDL